MIFAPVARRSAFNAPRSADLALQRFLLGSFANAAPAGSAGVSVTQDEKTTTLQLDVPGLAREQLSIQIVKHLLGERIRPLWAGRLQTAVLLLIQ